MNSDLVVLIFYFFAMIFAFSLYFIEYRFYGRSYKTLTLFLIHLFLIFVGARMVCLAYLEKYGPEITIVLWSLSGIIIIGEFLYFICMLGRIYYLYRKQSVRYSSHIEEAN